MERRYFMRKLKIFRILSVIMIMALVMSACSSSDKDNKSNDSSKDSGSVSSSTDDKGSSNNEKKDDSSGTSSNEADDGGKVNSGDKDNSGGNSSTLDLGDLDSDTLKPMPEEKSPSMYYYNAKEISSDTFFPDQEDILGKPFYFNGTILEEFDSITDYFQMNEFGKIISGLDTSSVGYKIMTKYGNVIVIDFTPYLIKYVKDNLDSNVMGLKYYKCWYKK